MSEGFESELETTRANASRLGLQPELGPSVASQLHVLYSLAVERSDLVERLLARWPAQARGYAELEGWHRLVHFAADPAAAERLALLEAAVGASQTFDAWLWGVQAARLVSEASDQTAAWQLVQRLGLIERLPVLATATELQRKSVLTVFGVSALISSAAANGAWWACDRVTQSAEQCWPSGPLAFWPRLARADADIASGHYAKALSRVDELTPSAPRRALASLACTRLHALIGLGAADEEPARLALVTFVEQVSLDAEDDQGQRQAQRLRERVRQLIGPHRALSDALEDAGMVDFLSAAPGTIQELFLREQRCKRYSSAERARRLEQLLRDVNDAIDRRPLQDRQDKLRLRLLWCRLIVDTGAQESFEICDMMLTTAVDEATALQALPLLMLAHDQRSVLRAQMAGGWRAALQDSSEAARLAAEQLRSNSEGTADTSRRSRAYLESLLPVFDRVVELHAIGALNLWQLGHLTQRADAFDASLFEDKSPQGAWQRFGVKLQAYAEQAQVLALDAARLAREQSQKFGQPVYVGTVAETLHELQAGLRPQDAVLQYFLVGSYLLCFSYGRSFFDWYVARLDTADSSDQALIRWLDELRGWTQGQAPASSASLVKLEQLLLPSSLVTSLVRARVTHLRIVPYGALYRFPFGRLATDAGTLAERWSLSLHPTGRLATKSATLKAAVPRPAAVTHVVGPEQESPFGPIDCSPAERAAIRGALGRVLALGPLQFIDGWRLPLANVLEQLHRAPLLHFLCHGHEGNELGQLPGLRLAAGNSPPLDSAKIARLPAGDCALVVLQSCWTGWMDHERKRPVQGVPQAFCDAGAWGVLAPLTQVPKALAATFSGVFYRALRFLPPELALQRTLRLLRSRGAALLERDAEARAELARLGGFDQLEYRYTGATGIRFGSWLSRLIGRFAFWWYESTLHRRKRAPLTSAVAEPVTLQPYQD